MSTKSTAIYVMGLIALSFLSVLGPSDDFLERYSEVDAGQIRFVILATLTALGIVLWAVLNSRAARRERESMVMRKPFHRRMTT